MSNQIFHFCLRWTVPHTPTNQQHLYELFSLLEVDRYIFQAEDTGDNPHYQCYFHKKKKQRVQTVKNLCLEHLHELESKSSVHLAPASSKGKVVLQTYCMKEDTRVAGPWANKKIYLGRDILAEHSMYPWQKSILRYAKTPVTDYRSILWIWDKSGGAGKTRLAKFCEYHDIGTCLSYGKAADLLYLVSKFPNENAYVFNLTKSRPTCLGVDELYNCMESVKDGMFISTKYECAKVLMDIPHVIVFANELPKIDAMAANRFVVYKLDGGALTFSHGHCDPLNFGE